MEQLACCEPAGVGLQMTHWSTRSLALVARQRGIAPTLSHSPWLRRWQNVLRYEPPVQLSFRLATQEVVHGPAVLPVELVPA